MSLRLKKYEVYITCIKKRLLALQLVGHGSGEYQQYVPCILLLPNSIDRGNIEMISPLEYSMNEKLRDHVQNTTT